MMTMLLFITIWECGRREELKQEIKRLGMIFFCFSMPFIIFALLRYSLSLLVMCVNITSGTKHVWKIDGKWYRAPQWYRVDRDHAKIPTTHSSGYPQLLGVLTGFFQEILAHYYQCQEVNQSWSAVRDIQIRINSGAARVCVRWFRVITRGVYILQLRYCGYYIRKLHMFPAQNSKCPSPFFEIDPDCLRTCSMSRCRAVNERFFVLFFLPEVLDLVRPPDILKHARKTYLAIKKNKNGFSGRGS